jgi:hypothetical protein
MSWDTRVLKALVNTGLKGDQFLEWGVWHLMQRHRDSREQLGITRGHAFALSKLYYILSTSDQPLGFKLNGSQRTTARKLIAHYVKLVAQIAEEKDRERLDGTIREY